MDADSKKIDLLERVLCRLKGRALQIFSLGAIKFPPYKINNFDYYFYNGRNGMELVISNGLSEDTIDILVNAINSADHQEYVNDEEVILHVSGFDLQFATV